VPTWVQGATHTGMRLQWKRRDGTFPDLTGVTITAKIKPVSGGGAAVALTGALAPDTSDPSHGYFTYAPSTLDVATAGTYQIQFKAVYADTKPDLTFSAEWEIMPAL
jgi:hypothetical protein